MAEVDRPPVHARCQIGPGVPQQDDDAAGQVFPEEVPRISPYDDGGAFVLVLLHVDADAPAAIVAHENLPAPHAVAGRVAATPMHHDAAVVHGVADLVLGVAEHLDGAAVHIAGHVVARNAVYLEPLARRQGASQVALGEGLVDLHLVGSGERLAHDLVRLRKVLGAQGHRDG